MTNNKRVATSGKVKVPKWGLMHTKTGKLVSVSDDEAIVRLAIFTNPSVPLSIVRLSGTVTYTVAK